LHPPPNPACASSKRRVVASVTAARDRYRHPEGRRRSRPKLVIGLQSQQPQCAAANSAAVVEPWPRRVTFTTEEPATETIGGQLANDEFDSPCLTAERRAGGHRHAAAIQRQVWLGGVEHHRSRETRARHRGDQLAPGRVEVGNSGDQETSQGAIGQAGSGHHAAKPETRPLDQRRGF
jgi:hypothetical protein